MKRDHQYRAVAEFEPQESVLVSWPADPESCAGENVETVTTELVKALADHVNTIVQCYYTEQEIVKEKLEKAQVNMDRVRLVRYESDDLILAADEELYVETTYPRDYGAEIVMDAQGKRAIVDFDNAYYTTAGANVYTREGRAIKAFGRWHAGLEGIDDILFTRLVSEGGDREFNGNGVMMCVEETEVAKRNPGLTRDEVEMEFKSIFNLDSVIWIPKSTYDDEDHFAGVIPGPDGLWNAYRSSTANGHIDEMARFVSEDTIILAEVTEEEAAHSEIDRFNKERLDLALEAIQGARTKSGQPFKVLRMPLPKAKYYTVNEEDVLHQIWMETKGELGDQLLDGSPYPEGEMVVLPAQSYCNFLITNGVIIGQKYYREGMDLEYKEKDDLARKVLEQAFPDRKIVQIDTMALNILGGGIHCATRQIPKTL